MLFKLAAVGLVGFGGAWLYQTLLGSKQASSMPKHSDGNTIAPEASTSIANKALDDSGVEEARLDEQMPSSSEKKVPAGKGNQSTLTKAGEEESNSQDALKGKKATEKPAVDPVEQFKQVCNRFIAEIDKDSGLHLSGRNVLGAFNQVNTHKVVSHSVDVRRSNSLVRPYVGILSMHQKVSINGKESDLLGEMEFWFGYEDGRWSLFKSYSFDSDQTVNDPDYFRYWLKVWGKTSQ